MDANTIDQFYFALIPCWASSTFLETLKQLLMSSQCPERGQVFFDDSLDQKGVMFDREHFHSHSKPWPKRNGKQ